MTACARFTPNNSGQRLPPTYYRGCWHVVSRGFLLRYRHSDSSYSIGRSSLATELYDPKTFITHAALLRQAFAHCGRFPTAASRRSLGRVSVPVWPFTLSGRLRIVALLTFPWVIPVLQAGCLRVTHPSAANHQESKLSIKSARLACIRHAASVRPEPGSNSPRKFVAHFESDEIDLISIAP
ncbi:permease, partial [Mucor ambiguus]